MLLLDTELVKISTTGHNNTYIGGYRAGYYNQTGDNNIGIGVGAINHDSNTLCKRIGCNR